MSKAIGSKRLEIQNIVLVVYYAKQSFTTQKWVVFQVVYFIFSYYCMQSSMEKQECAWEVEKGKLFMVA